MTVDATDTFATEKAEMKAKIMGAFYAGSVAPPVGMVDWAIDDIFAGSAAAFGDIKPLASRAEWERFEQRLTIYLLSLAMRIWLAENGSPSAPEPAAIPRAFTVINGGKVQSK